MTKRIFRSICTVALSVFLACAVLFMGVLYDYFSGVQRGQLRMQTSLAAQGAAHEGMAYFEGLVVKNYRVTWVGADGAVLYDSESSPAGMENHLEREEIRQALAQGSGESARYSATLMERSMYCAQRLPDGTVLRLSIAHNSLLTLLLGMLQPSCVIFAVALVLSLVLASRLSKEIVKPLNALDLDDPLDNEGYDELTPLLRRIALQQNQIRMQERALRKKQNEFEAVTMGMAEGIVLLNEKWTILSINPAAARLLSAGEFCAGKSILSVNRSLELQKLLREAEAGKHGETVMELGGGRYQADASPVVSEGAVSGIVLLLLDVTEKEKAERLRREFTANVSHELKTPLHAISGYAELLAGGMVKQQDVGRFSGQIYAEAQRMIRLVEDIIRLSHLDEGAEGMKREETDLYALARETLASLRGEAEAANIRLTLEGGPAKVCGIPQLLRGILYNLCDNAIKYNRPGGCVEVTVENGADGVCLSVSDTGIGIPAEHRERIFERFYRVDKSHSKEIGGTGLGLSIVKHAARLHNAVIEVHSVVDSGTTVTVRFPREAHGGSAPEASER